MPEQNGLQSNVKLSCRNLWKVYGDRPKRHFAPHLADASTADRLEQIRADGAIAAAADVSFDVHSGEIFVIMGLSGSGKSTVVRCLSRLVEPTAGSVYLDDTDLLSASPRELIDLRRHRMGMVFQNFGLLPHLSVLDNVAFPLKLQGVARADRERRAAEVVDLVGLGGRESALPSELSGGQQQRVGIARSLAVEPDVWFLDEPFSALDPLIRRQMQDEFLRIQRVLRKSIVFITHDFLEALRIADRMMIMRGGEVVQLGTPTDLVLSPADDYVAEFTGDVPLLRVIDAAHACDRAVHPRDAMPTVSHSTPVETVLPMLCEAPEGLCVLGEDGAPLGVLTPNSLIAAMADTDEATRAEIKNLTGATTHGQSASAGQNGSHHAPAVTTSTVSR